MMQNPAYSPPSAHLEIECKARDAHASTMSSCRDRKLINTWRASKSPSERLCRRCVTIREILPDAEEVISYGMPAFRLEGKVIAGFAAFTNHLAYMPHSGSLFTELRDALAGYKATKGSLHFPIDKPLPEALVKKLIAVRLRQVKRS